MSVASSPAFTAMGGLGLAPDLSAGRSAEPSHFDARETRPAEMREHELLGRLPNLLRSAKVARGWAWLLSGVDARSVASREALARLPVLRRHDLPGLQAGAPPFGGLVPEPLSAFERIFVSAGRVFEAETTGYDAWRAARALFAAGIRKGDAVINCLPYHMEPTGFVVDSGCRAIGAPVVPAGPAASADELDRRLDLIEHLGTPAYAGTIELLDRLHARADETGRDISALRIAFIADGGSAAATRAVAGPPGVAMFEAMMSPELGVLAYQTPARDGFVLNEDLIAEIVWPGTGEPVEPGEAGELVITAFDPHRPFIRLATGRLSRLLPGSSACGRTNTRLAGWLGCAAQEARIGAVTVTPAQVAEVRRRHPGLGRLRLVVRADGARLAVESPDRSEPLASAVAATLRTVAHLTAPVELVAPGALPNDGRVISDERG